MKRFIYWLLNAVRTPRDTVTPSIPKGCVYKAEPNRLKVVSTPERGKLNIIKKKDKDK